MHVFKRLIYKEWIRVFLGATFILYMLVSVANLISGFMRSSVTTFEVLIGHIVETPAFLNMILPVACLVASMFSINKLKNRNELTAIFASGYSRRSFIFDIFQISLLVALFQFSLASFIDPVVKGNRFQLYGEEKSKLRAFESKGLSSSTIGSGKIWYKTKDYFFAFAAFDKNLNILKDVSLYYLSKEQKISQIIQAKQATYLNDKSWLFEEMSFFDYLSQEDFPTHLKLDKKIITFNESPSDFLQIESDITTLPIRDLKDYIDKLEEAGIGTSEYQVLYYNKFSSALICIIFSLIASIGIFNPNRRTSSFGQNIIFVFIFTLLYWLVYSYSIELGNSSKIDPLLACFAVPILFSSFLLFFFVRNRRLR